MSQTATITIPFEDTGLEVEIQGFGHMEDESVTTDRGLWERRVWKCDDVDFLPLYFNAEEVQAINRYIEENVEDLKVLLEEKQ